MKLTYYGHSCLAVHTAGKTLLFDPFIRPNDRAKHINVEAVQADYLLISHGHFDHVADAVEIANRTGATLVSNYEISVWAANQGVARTHGMNHGGAWKFDFGRVKYVPAIHSSSFADGSYAGHPGGFVIETAEGNFYFSGDTALTMDMKLIGESTSLQFAALCIGDNFTMGVDDAIKAADFIRCKRIVGIHYDTFPPIQIHRQDAIGKFKAAGKDLLLPDIGETIVA
ncbi:MAG TPA: metal-dependent hydrolase [Verrucomicrobiota bacterium]|nr:metal-dependent hydrolase [Verrucomicrobiota bacterium]